MVRQPLEQLELRVNELIQRMKSLRTENAKLQKERHLIRDRIEKLLGTLNHVAGEKKSRE